MAKIRARFSKKSKYYISKHAFLTAYHYSLNYWDWKKEHDEKIGLQHGGEENGRGIGDPTAMQAIHLADLAEKILLIEETARETEPALGPYLLRYVTNEEMTFDRLKAEGLPCEKDMFYDRRRKYYFLLSKKLGL